MGQRQTIRLTVDRTESGLLVCIDDFGNQYRLPAGFAGPFHDGDILYATFSEGRFLSARFAEEETKTKKAALQTRLNRLIGQKNGDCNH